MLLNDILRDTEARIKELQPVVDEASELKAAAEALRKVGVSPSATITAMDLDNPTTPEDKPVLVNSGASVPMEMETRGPNPGIHRAPKPNGPAGTVLPTPAPESDRVFNTRYRRGIEADPATGMYKRFTFKRKDDESSYKFHQSVAKKTALNWLTKGTKPNPKPKANS